MEVDDDDDEEEEEVKPKKKRAPARKRKPKEPKEEEDDSEADPTQRGELSAGMFLAPEIASMHWSMDTVPLQGLCCMTLQTCEMVHVAATHVLQFSS